MAFNSKWITSSSTWLLPNGSGVAKYKKLRWLRLCRIRTLANMNPDSEILNSNPGKITCKVICKVGSICFARKLKSWSQEPICFSRSQDFWSWVFTVNNGCRECSMWGLGEWLQLIGSESRSVWSSYPLIGWSWSTCWVSFQRFSAG